MEHSTRRTSPRELSQQVISFLPLLVSVLASAGLLLAHPLGGNGARESFAAVSLLVVGFGFLWRKRMSGAGDLLLLLASAYTLSAIFGSGQLELPDTAVPHLRSYLKVFLALSVALVLFLFSRDHRGYSVVLVTGLLATSLLLLWHYHGVTTRSLPLLIYVSAGFLYCNLRPDSSGSAPIVRASMADFLPVAFLGWMLVSVVRSPIPAEGFHFLSASAVGVVLFWIARFYAGDRLPYLGFTAAFAAQIVVFTVFLLVLRARGESLGKGDGLLAGFNINVVAGYFAICLPVVFAFLFVRRGVWRASAFVLGVVTLGLLLITQSRTAQVAGTVGLVCTVACLPGLLGQRGSLRRLGLIVAVFFLTLAGYFLIVRVFDLPGPLTHLMSVGIRWLLWQTYLHNALTFVPLAGFGPGTYELNFHFPPGMLTAADAKVLGAVARESGIAAHAHNQWVQTFFDFGFVGLVLLVLMAAASIYAVGKPVRGAGTSVQGIQDWERYGLLGCLAALALHGLFEFSFAYASLMFPPVLILGRLYSNRPWGPTITLPAWLPRLLSVLLLIAATTMLVPISRNLHTLVQARRLVQGKLVSDLQGGLDISGTLKSSTCAALLDLEKNYVYNPFDWQTEQFRGVVMESVHRSGSAQGLDLAASAYRRCIELHQYSVFCRRALARVVRQQGNLTESLQLERAADRIDPWRIGW